MTKPSDILSAMTNSSSVFSMEEGKLCPSASGATSPMSSISCIDENSIFDLAKTHVSSSSSSRPRKPSLIAFQDSILRWSRKDRRRSDGQIMTRTVPAGHRGGPRTMRQSMSQSFQQLACCSVTSDIDILYAADDALVKSRRESVSSVSLPNSVLRVMCLVGFPPLCIMVAICVTILVLNGHIDTHNILSISYVGVLIFVICITCIYKYVQYKKFVKSLS